MANQLLGVLIEASIYGVVALGVLVTFRILDFPDLTVDGSFPLGAAVVVVALIAKIPAPVAFALAFVAGFLAGSFSALIHNLLKIPNLMAGILTMTMLYSVNNRILGSRPNISLVQTETFIDRLIRIGASWGTSEDFLLLLFFLFVFLLIRAGLDLFFRTDIGITMGILGSNEQMIVSQGIDPGTLKIIGVGLANGLVAIAGGLGAMYQGFVDLNSGTGTVVMGLAMVMLGEIIVPRISRMGGITLRVFLGAIAYRTILALGRQYGFLIKMQATDFRFLNGALIILLLFLAGRRGLRNRRRKV